MEKHSGRVPLVGGVDRLSVREDVSVCDLSNEVLGLAIKRTMRRESGLPQRLTEGSSVVLS